MFADLSMQFAPLWPVWLIVVLALALLGAIGYGTVTMFHKHVRPRWAALLAGLRVAAWLLFLLAVLQPVLSWSRLEPPLPTVAVLVDTSKSMQPHLNGALGALKQGDFAKALDERFRARWFRFDASSRPIQKGDLANLQADGGTTRIADSLAAAQRLLNAEGTACDRVLLVTDGLDQGGADPAALARQLGLRVDVLAPKAAAANEGDGIEIAEVQGARRVLLGSETHFRVTLKSRQPVSQDRKVTVKMAEDGAHLSDVPLVFAKDTLEQTVTLAHRPATVGARQYEFTIDGSTAKPAPFLVQVLDGKFEILVLEDTWRWEYKYLHRLFEVDPSFRFTALLARGGGAFTQFGSPDRRVNLVGFPQSRSELEGFDIFFLGDVDPAKWPPRLVAGLAHQIEEGGKSLVVIAGSNLARIVDVPDLHALLPVEIVPASSKPVSGPVPVRLQPDASSSPFFFQIRADQVDALPPLDQIYPPLRKRPGATVLVESAKHRNPYGPLIVAAEHTVGRGRVLFIGTDTLWKWHTLAPVKDGPTPYTLFWQQAMRALTPERSRLGAVDVWLRTSRTRAEPGQTIELQAEVESERSLARLKLEAIAVLPDGQRFPLALEPDASRPNMYRAEFAPPRPGTYSITATAISEGQRSAEGSTLVYVREAEEEATSSDVDVRQLARLANLTGGQIVDLARPETWPAPDASTAQPVLQTRTFAPWGNLTLLLLLCLVLGADWFFRLMRGLV